MGILDDIFGPGSILGRPAPAPAPEPAPKPVDPHVWHTPGPRYWELKSPTLGTMIHLDLNTGEMIFGENYTPDAAALLFWETVGGRR